MAARFELFFCIPAFLELKEIRVPLRIRVLPSGTVSQTLDFGHDMPTIGECDINSDSSWSGDDSTRQ